VPPLARLHVIFYESTLAQVATALRAGMLQMVGAMIEAGYVNPALALDDPLEALGVFSRDPGLCASAPLTDGRRRTLVELNREFYIEARAFADLGGFKDVVPEHDRLLDLWDETLTHLERHDMDKLARRLDWVLKRRLLETVMDRQGLSWQSPEIKVLDQMYASLDETDGLFWPLEAAGWLDTVVDEAEVRRAVATPPADTRAWTRAALMRLAGRDRIEQVDWHRVRLRLPSARNPYGRLRTVFLPLPWGDTREQNAAHFANDAPISVVAEALAATDEWPAPPTSVIASDYWTVRQGGIQ
jgi:proteasome accessory factor A